MKINSYSTTYIFNSEEEAKEAFAQFILHAVIDKKMSDYNINNKGRARQLVGEQIGHAVVLANSSEQSIFAEVNAKHFPAEIIVNLENFKMLAQDF